MFGRDGERARGEEFLEWLADPARQEGVSGLGAFARWAVLAVEDGELRAVDLWYPKAMERKSTQFPREDWDEAKAMYITREMRYCCGDGRAEEVPEEWAKSRESCWVGGSCAGSCFSDSKPQ